MQTTAIRTVAKSLPQNKVILLTCLISNSYIPYTDLRKYFAPEFAAFWFMNGNHASSEVCFTANLALICKEVEHSHDDFITEHFRKYSEPDLPFVWKILEVILMGTLSKLYSNFSDTTAKHAVQENL